MAKHDLGDIDTIRKNLETWLQNRLPDAKNLKLEELGFPEESGESSVSLILKATNGGETLRLVCRMKPRVSQCFDEHDIELQYHLMSIVSEYGIPVPPLLGFEKDTSIVDSDFYVMGFVDGQVPTDNPPYAFGSWVTELNDNERTTMWRNGLEALASIHNINTEKCDIASMPSSAIGISPAQHEIDKFNELIDDELRQTLSPVLIEALDYVNSHAPKDGTRRLCWGDARVGNIIWKDLTPAAVIDWEMASIADPLMDVSWWYWVDYVNSVGLGVNRLGGLPTREAIYTQWQELTGLPTENSDYYDLLSLVRYAIILEKKFVAMKNEGLGSIDNFCVPIVKQQLDRM